MPLLALALLPPTAGFFSSTTTWERRGTTASMV
jgi:hypothetical protein